MVLVGFAIAIEEVYGLMAMVVLDKLAKLKDMSDDLEFKPLGHKP